jgi:Axonemal dynein light chain
VSLKPTEACCRAKMNDSTLSHNNENLILDSCRLLDEIIRQVTINCTERGLLLLRVRDEINMRDEAYERQVAKSSQILRD